MQVGVLGGAGAGASKGDRVGVWVGPGWVPGSYDLGGLFTSVSAGWRMG
jgi:hypothetical protein